MGQRVAHVGQMGHRTLLGQVDHGLVCVSTEFCFKQSYTTYSLPTCLHFTLFYSFLVLDSIPESSKRWAAEYM